jgi:hypothetical protein
MQETAVQWTSRSKFNLYFSLCSIKKQIIHVSIPQTVEAHKRHFLHATCHNVQLLMHMLTLCITDSDTDTAATTTTTTLISSTV